MEILLKAAAAAILGCGVCLLLKKSNPEMGMALALMICVAGLALGTALLKPVLEFLSAARKMSGLSEAHFYPVIKAVGIGVCTKLCVDICKDSGQASMGGMLETLGTVCALYTALPLLESLLDILGGLI